MNKTLFYKLISVKCFILLRDRAKIDEIYLENAGV